MHPESGFWIAPNWLQIGKKAMMSQFQFFDAVSFLLSILATGPSFMSIS